MLTSSATPGESLRREQYLGSVTRLKTAGVQFTVLDFKATSEGPRRSTEKARLLREEGP